MAINPNTNFIAGAILTADQQNRFGRGVMAYNQSTTSDNTITAEEIQITGSSFTAVANRYYKATFFDPQMYASTTQENMTMRIRQTNISGTILATSFVTCTTSYFQSGFCSATFTLSAGATNLVATLQYASGNGQALRGTGKAAFLLVEDIGPS